MRFLIWQCHRRFVVAVVIVDVQLYAVKLLVYTSQLDMNYPVVRVGPVSQACSSYMEEGGRRHSDRRSPPHVIKRKVSVSHTEGGDSQLYTEKLEFCSRT